MVRIDITVIATGAGLGMGCKSARRGVHDQGDSTGFGDETFKVLLRMLDGGSCSKPMTGSAAETSEQLSGVYMVGNAPSLLAVTGDRVAATETPSP